MLLSRVYGRVGPWQVRRDNSRYRCVTSLSPGIVRALCDADTRPLLPGFLVPTVCYLGYRRYCYK